jgi:hypothetical protein
MLYTPDNNCIPYYTKYQTHGKVGTLIEIAIPKGSLEEQTLLLFKQADLEIKKTDRQYPAPTGDPPIRA